MNYVMDALRKKEAEKKLPMIRLEIDYELMTLYDALQAKDYDKIVQTKETLEHLREEWLTIV